MTKWIAIALLAAAAEAAAPYYSYEHVSEFEIEVLVAGKNSLMYPSEYRESITLTSDLVGMNKGSLLGIPNGDTTITVTASGVVGGGVGAKQPLFSGATSQNVTSGALANFLITLVNINPAPTEYNSCPLITSATIAPGKAVRNDTSNPSVITYTATDSDGSISGSNFVGLDLLDTSSLADDCGDGVATTHCFKPGAAESLSLHGFQLSVTDNDPVPCTSTMEISIEVIKRKSDIHLDFSGIAPTVVSMLGNSGLTIPAGPAIDVEFNVDAKAGSTVTVTADITCGALAAVPIKDTLGQDIVCSDPTSCVVSLPYQGRTTSERCVASFVFTDVDGRATLPLEYIWYSGTPTVRVAPHATFAFVSDVDFTVKDTAFSLVVYVEDVNDDLGTAQWDCGALTLGPTVPPTDVHSGGISHYQYTSAVDDPTATPTCTFTVGASGNQLVKTFNFNTLFPAS